MKKQLHGTWFHYDQGFSSNPMRLKMFELLQIGEICLEAGYSIPAHRQWCHEISYVLSGRGYFEQDGEKQPVSAGSLIITPESGIHSICASEEESLNFAYVGFQFIPEEFPDKAIMQAFRSDRQAVCRDSSHIYYHFRKCLDEFYRTGRGSRLITEACLMQIVVWTVRDLWTPASTPDYPIQTNSPGQLIYRIQRYIEYHISAPLTVSGIAADLGYSPGYLSHLFLEKIGTSLSSYITEQKINRAKELIRLNRFSFAEISEQLGYLNPQSFTRVFRRATGLSPSEYLRSL